ncbi:MAG: hypothetical protein F4X65_01700 [Chloroflexi bacterium]|nr:hypothetical protein [Chloroflexota bacterium]
MPPTAVNVAAILLLVLPGFLSYRFAVWRRADPTHRSPLWQLSEILEHSAYVHLFGAGLVAVLHSALQWWFGLDSYAKFLIQNGPNAFLDKHFAEAILWFILYPVYVIVASSILGSYDVPQRVSSFIITVLGIPSRLKWMRGLPVPRDPYPQEPVWHYAFNLMSNNYTTSVPHVLVNMKSGDIYFGEIATYPLVADTELDKDFLITNVRYYRGGDFDEERRLFDIDGIGAVLLNTANVDSILLYYQEIPSIQSG